MAPDGRFGGEDLVHDARGQAFAHGLRALGEETPGLAPRGPSGQTSRGGEPGVLGTEQGAQAADDAGPPMPSATTAALATSASAVNAPGSVTARSASTLRSTVTPARRKPWMNRL
jgi:hypothetical protein